MVKTDECHALIALPTTQIRALITTIISRAKTMEGTTGNTTATIITTVMMAMHHTAGITIKEDTAKMLSDVMADITAREAMPDAKGTTVKKDTAKTDTTDTADTQINTTAGKCNAIRPTIIPMQDTA